MGREPETDPVGSLLSKATDGALSPPQFAKLLLTCVHDRRTGTLLLAQGHEEREIRFIRGAIVDASSSLEHETIVATLVDSNTVPTKQIQWIRKHTESDEPTLEALLGAGTLERSTLDVHTGLHNHFVLGGCFGWTGGNWTWTDAPEVAFRFDPDLLATIPGLDAAIDGVLRGFDLSALRSFIDAPDAGSFVSDPRLTQGKGPRWLSKPFTGLREFIGAGASGADLLSHYTRDELRAAALLWLLEAGGWVHRRNPPAALVPLDAIATIQMGTPKHGPASEKKRVKRKKKRPSTPKAEAPIAAMPEATTPETAPPAPKKPPKRKKSSRARLEDALVALENEDFDHAFVKLMELRQDRPSCPDTLASLGFAAWRSGNHGTNVYDGPEDYILLALTFDPAHPKALEFYARIAIDKGSIDDARNRLLQVLQVSPESPWAKDALEAISPTKSGGLRLWPKGKA